MIEILMIKERKQEGHKEQPPQRMGMGRAMHVRHSHYHKVYSSIPRRQILLSATCPTALLPKSMVHRSLFVHHVRLSVDSDGDGVSRH